MSKGINKVILVGTCGKEPETRYMPSGGAVTSISVATNEQWTDKQSGQKQERTEWHNVTFFGRLGEIAGEYLHKGSQVYVEGKLRTESYEKDGVTRYTTKIIASEMQMLGGGVNRQAGQGQPAAANQGGGQRQRRTANAANASGPVDAFDDDIPFRGITHPYAM